VEKVRSQFLSLRQPVIDIAERIQTTAIRATLPNVNRRIRANSKLRARISADNGKAINALRKRIAKSLTMER
jgi:hypothetical protein